MCPAPKGNYSNVTLEILDHNRPRVPTGISTTTCLPSSICEAPQPLAPHLGYLEKLYLPVHDGYLNESLVLLPSSAKPQLLKPSIHPPISPHAPNTAANNMNSSSNSNNDTSSTRANMATTRTAPATRSPSSASRRSGRRPSASSQSSPARLLPSSTWRTSKRCLCPADGDLIASALRARRSRARWRIGRSWSRKGGRAVSCRRAIRAHGWWRGLWGG